MVTRKPVPARGPVELSTSPSHHPNNPYTQQSPFPSSPAPVRAPPAVPGSQRDKTDYFEAQSKPEAEAGSPEEKDWWDESDPEEDLIDTDPPLTAEETASEKTSRPDRDRDVLTTTTSSFAQGFQPDYGSAQPIANAGEGQDDARFANMAIDDVPSKPRNDFTTYTRFGQAPSSSLNKAELVNPADVWAEPVPSIKISAAAAPPYPISPDQSMPQPPSSQAQWAAPPPPPPLSSQQISTSDQPTSIPVPSEDPWKDVVRSSSAQDRRAAKALPFSQNMVAPLPEATSTVQAIDPWKDQAPPITSNKRASTSAQAFDAVTTSVADPWIEESSTMLTKPPRIDINPPILPQRKYSEPETPQSKAKRQRNEVYQVKNMRWYDFQTRQTRNSSILIQNANGPCPLLALVNALVLTTPPSETTALIEALSYREQVSLGLLLDAVFDELTSGRRGDVTQELPDIGDLYSFLITLHTGMNVNPRFIASNEAEQGMVAPQPGTFEMTKEMRLYSTFGIPLIHGWLPKRGDEAYLAFQRQKSAQSYEDAQNMQFHAEELEAKLHAEGLSDEEQDVFTDVIAIREFATAYPTQLSDYGLEVFKQWIKPGQVVILFRNDHFSTMYKQPDNGRLLTLVTDAGYATHDEIVWESLADVNGMYSELFSGDFRSVNHSIGTPSSFDTGNEWQTVKGKNSRPQQNQSTIPEESGSSFPIEAPRDTEQEDHDLALALQLQEEEEATYRGHAADRAREEAASQRFLSQQQQQSAPPAAPASPARVPPRRTSQQEQRPAQPPRPVRAPVSRPADTNDDDAAPPPYTATPTDQSKPFGPPVATQNSIYAPGRPNMFLTSSQGQMPGSPMTPTGRRMSGRGSVNGPSHPAVRQPSIVTKAQTVKEESGEKCVVM
jgi:hypothetical protein